jgi:hypothetical protein
MIATAICKRMCIKHRASQSPQLLLGRWCGTKYGLVIAQALLQADRTCQSTLEQAILDYGGFGTTVVRG